MADPLLDFYAYSDTLPNAHGVPPTVVTLSIRHKKPSLSKVTYNDPRMTDANKALDEMPNLFGWAIRTWALR